MRERANCRGPAVEMQKTAAAQALLTILMSKTNGKKNSRKWESRQKKWENYQRV
jgi:hypothetical protein